MMDFCRQVCVATMFVFAWGAVSAQSSTETEIRRLEELYTDAYVRQDQRALAALLADDGTFTTSDGHTVDKASRVGALSRPFADMRDSINGIRIIGEVAIVNVTTSYSSSGRRLAYSVLRVWARSGGEWRIVATQSTPRP